MTTNGYSVIRIECPAEDPDGLSCAGLWVYRVAMAPCGALQPVELVERTCSAAHEADPEHALQQLEEATAWCLAGGWIDYQEAPALTGAGGRRQ